ncbi:ATP-binding protein [Nonomuraea ferruginea]|uniref:ATP-binding protein n=1 Tax=Nonomuraea ferruginea TaxID=46174 RepID=A0ABT4SV33_9ACTN|nr:ATP-binding protein [Nonomuraea ferruginea]MDA0640833.1 ATP-binding protein [Nonomuraea ferruginea]
MTETTVLADHPHSLGRSLVWRLRDDARAVGDARNLIRRALLLVGLRRDLVDDAVLMVSELVTNVVLHGDAPYELVVRVEPAEVVCMVVDAGAVLPVRRGTDAQTENGRGLLIVAELSAGLFGCIPQTFATCPGMEGKATWFALPLAGGRT